MNSDQPWFDVHVTIRLAMRTEAWSADRASESVQRCLDGIDWNPGGWDNYELIDEPQVTVSQSHFHPQGYRTQDPSPL